MKLWLDATRAPPGVAPKPGKPHNRVSFGTRSLHVKKRPRQIVSGLLIIATAMACADDPVAERPNIILIVADDLGYSDIGAFGGEIRTPSLDALARDGVQLTSFHASPTCGPTRAMLMTGVDHHRAGVGTNAAALIRLEQLRGRPGYEGYLNDRVVTFVRLLQDSGYHTFMTGKWDLGKQPGKLPTDRGFDRYFGLADGGASHFSDGRGTTRPAVNVTYFEDDQPVERLPGDFYSSTSYVERILDFVDNRPDDGEPFLAYLAFTAPHWPLQVPDDWIDRYQGAYDQGWHAIRQARLDRQIELGILPETAALATRNRAVDDWDGLSPARRRVELKRIELYAAMVELMDQQIGRLLEAVTRDEDRETVVIFVSDNGAEGNSIGELLDNEYWVPATFDNRLDNMGRVDSYVWLGVGWAQATVSPFRIYKSFTTEGGIRTPAIVYSSAGRFRPDRKDAVMTVRDIAPTVLELAGVEHPGTSHAGRDVHPMSGRSALPYLTGAADTIHADAPIGWELYGNRALIKGDWKAVLIWPPEGDGEWRLFNIKDDPSETVDLSGREPERLAELVDAWAAYAEENGVVVMDRDVGYARYP